jgi:putative DNA primase/helicase
MLLGEQILPHDTVRICEGWATACSIYEAVGAPVVCAFNADNLVNVSILLRRKYVFSSFQICADNDIHLKENIGLKYGREAAKLIGASLHYPIFSEGISGKLTDFNDLFCHAGIEEVERQIIIVRP